MQWSTLGAPVASGLSIDGFGVKRLHHIQCKLLYEMAKNIYHNPNYHFPQPRQPGGMATYLLGVGDMPLSCHQDYAIAIVNHFLDNQNQGDHQAGADSDNENENLDPRL